MMLAKESLPSIDGMLGQGVLLASMELLNSDDPALVPALLDNGASDGTSCSKSLNRAIPGTKRLSDAGNIGLGPTVRSWCVGRSA